MPGPIIKQDDNFYMLLREENIEKFNQHKASGETSDLTNCDLRGLDLRGLDAAGLDLSGCYFRQADLRGIDFSSCKLDGASIHSAKISGTLFPKLLMPEEIELSLLHGTRMRIEG